jgi:hypothetical protein
VIDTPTGTVSGALVSATGDVAVVIEADGRVTTVAKAQATGLRVADAPAPDPTPGPAPEPEPIAAPPPEPAPTPWPAAKPERDYFPLGVMVANGVAYAHWRGGGDGEGSVAYAGDLGLGFNFSRSIGLYALGGGYFGARLFDKEVKGNLGRIGVMIVGRGQYFMGSFGLAGAFSRLAGRGTTFKDGGLAIPVKLMGVIPLPKHLYIALGLGYDLAFVNSFEVMFNGIGFQAVIGLW